MYLLNKHSLLKKKTDVIESSLNDWMTDNILALKHVCRQRGDLETLSYCSNLYCSILWYDCSKTALKTLRIAYNKSFKKLLDVVKYKSASEMFVCLNISSFDELLRKYVYSFDN